MALGIADAIGDTPIVEPRHVARSLGVSSRELKFENPTGSMKDRVAKAMIPAAERDGRLSQGTTVVDYTVGTTRISLALVCAATGHPRPIRKV